jgi:hypothetical protein
LRYFVNRFQCFTMSQLCHMGIYLSPSGQASGEKKF